MVGIARAFAGETTVIGLILVVFCAPDDGSDSMRSLTDALERREKTLMKSSWDYEWPASRADRGGNVHMELDPDCDSAIERRVEVPFFYVAVKSPKDSWWAKFNAAPPNEKPVFMQRGRPGRFLGVFQDLRSLLAVRFYPEDTPLSVGLRKAAQSKTTQQGDVLSVQFDWTSNGFVSNIQYLFDRVPYWRLREFTVKAGDSIIANRVLKHGETEGIWYPQQSQIAVNTEVGGLPVPLRTYTVTQVRLTSTKYDTQSLYRYKDDPEVSFRDDVAGTNRPSIAEKAKVKEQLEKEAAKGKDALEKALQSKNASVDARPQPFWTNLRIGAVIGISIVFAVAVIRLRQRVMQ
jgi:hypothetical protein